MFVVSNCSARRIHTVICLFVFLGVHVYIHDDCCGFLKNGSIAGCVLKEISSACVAYKLRGFKVIRTASSDK